MAYDMFLADRVQELLRRKTGSFESKKMMGGLCYLVDNKMCVGIVNDKLMCRIGPDNYEHALSKEFCSEMNFTGRPMKGYVFIEAEGVLTDNELQYWIGLCLAFNPIAKSSRKK